MATKGKKSAGILLYRKKSKMLEVLLVHPGGPFWAKKDLESWSIPKGELDEDKNPLDCARREFEEETGQKAEGHFVELQPCKLKSGKIIYAWAVESEFDLNAFKSNTFKMEWPPKSGKQKEFEEVDKADWFIVEEAIKKINPAQVAFIKELEQKLRHSI